MKKILTKKNIIISIAIILISCMILSFNSTHRRSDTEFNQSSDIYITEVSDVQTQNLSTLCKVWGFVKYRHPSITDGTINWDAELFRVMPLVLQAKDTTENSKVIFDWINQFEFEVPASQVELNGYSNFEVLLEPDLAWIYDTDLIGADCSEYLVSLSKLIVNNVSDGYATLDSGIFVNLDSEYPYYNMSYDDSGLKLLGLFRYWNTMEYFFPYKNLMDEDWNLVLDQMIPKFVNGDDRETYLLAISQLSTYINDSHGYVIDNDIIEYFGVNHPSIEFENIDNQIVVSEVSDSFETTLKLGDIILSVDGVTIEDRLEECFKYLSVSSDDKFLSIFSRYLLASNKDLVEYKVLRDGQTISLDVAYYDFQVSISGETKSQLIKNNKIGYINPSLIMSGDIVKIMSEFKDTEGIIVDLRYYPSSEITYTLAEYLIPQPTVFAKIGFSNLSNPGQFLLSHDVSSGNGFLDDMTNIEIYQNDVILLINEESASQPEYATMSLSNAPNATILGTPSNGADGDVVKITLPGAVSAYMSGLSILHPDRTQTQRVGIQPDIYFQPTIEGIKQGKDELLDKAISLILE